MTQPFSFFTSGSNLGKEGAVFIANALRELKNLRILNFDIRCLLLLFKTYICLFIYNLNNYFLYISKNNLEIEVAKSLANGLK
jgi:hypothetical protein